MGVGTVEPVLLTVTQAAQMLAASPWDVRQLCESGRLDHGKIGGRIVIPVTAVRRFAAELVPDLAAVHVCCLHTELDAGPALTPAAL